jgi:hypothetical protein
MVYIYTEDGLSKLPGGSVALKSSGADPSPRIRNMIKEENIPCAQLRMAHSWEYGLLIWDTAILEPL